MKAQRRGIRIAILAFVCVLSLFLSIRVIAQEDEVWRRSETILRLTIRNARVKAMARERYGFVQRLDHQFGLPFYSTMETSCPALFPVGRSDRIYLRLWNAYWPEGVAKGKN